EGNLKIENPSRPWVIFDHPAGALNGGLQWWQDSVTEMELFYDDVNESLRFWDTPTGVVRLMLSRSGNLVAQGSLNEVDPPPPHVTGAGTRMMWYPEKAAFRAGNLHPTRSTYWDKDSIGYYSFALGQDVRATGENAIAFGKLANAAGKEAIAIGNSDAIGNFSIALGANNTSTGIGALATGNSTLASGTRASAFGQHTVASGHFSAALGERTIAGAKNVLAIGRYNTGAGNTGSWVDYDPLFEIGMGTSDTTRANAMTIFKNAGALWQGTFDATPDAPPAQGAGTRMMWYPAKAAFRAGHADGAQWEKDSIGTYSVALGYSTIASGSRSTALGQSTKASELGSTALGYLTTASGQRSTAMGHSTAASGLIST
ncbi:MAG: hypothetical protein R3330_17955, partial [Saprospiraceae bacterium]|nr:hypothetical protein [Saprospiraceae bacterium]